VAYAGAGQATEAEKLAASAGPGALRVPLFYDWLENHYDQTMQSGNASRAATALLHIDPDGEGPLMGYALRMLDRGPDGVPEALRALDRRLAIDPEDPSALETKAMFLFRSGHTEEARPLFAHAAAVGPTSGPSHVALAVLARREGRSADAVTELEAARRIEPGDAWVLDALHDAYTSAGDVARAADIDRARRYFATKQGRTPSAATRWLPDSWR
jgi:Flp pilus assembly protein TadD